MDGAWIIWFHPRKGCQLRRSDAGNRLAPTVEETVCNLQLLKSRRHNVELPQALQISEDHLTERIGMDGEVVQPPGVTDGELLQARASRPGNRVTEIPRAVEPNAIQPQLGEPSEDAGRRHGEAEEI